jgi:PBP1b-binding outer membrane lipoprotein LpoB
MSKFIKPALAAFLTLGVLMTGCSQAEDAAKTVDQAKDKAAETADKAKSTATDLVALKDGLGNLKTGADKTLAAVQSGDFATAKMEGNF